MISSQALINFQGSCRIGVLAEQFQQQTLCPLPSFVGEFNRLRFAARVGDAAPLMQSVHGIPVEALPGPGPIVQSQVKQGKNRLIDLARVEFMVNPRDGN